MNYALFALAAVLFAMLVLIGCRRAPTETEPRADERTPPTSSVPAAPAVTDQDILDLEDDVKSQLDAANTYVQQNPNNGRSYAIRAMVYSRLEKIPQQIADLDKAIDLLSADPKQHALLQESIYSRGLAYQTVGKDLSALKDFTRVLESAPTYSSVLQARSFSYLRLSRHDDALADVDRAIAATPEDPGAFELRSRIRAALKDSAGAESDLAEYRRLLGE